MAAPAREDGMIGAVIDGRYRIVERIGQGGSGVLYRAVQLTVGRDVALKMLSAYSLSDERAEQRFENEARIVSRLHHPRTLKLFDYGRTPDGKPYIACELLRGTPLDKVLARDGRLGVERTLRFLSDVCGALEEAHTLGVIHRDLKPANVFIEKIGTEEHAKVLDFGIAKILNQESVTAVGTVIGTPAYMPPEAANGAVLDARSDLYSLGVTAYECLTGVKPYSAELPMAVLQMHVTHPVPRVPHVPIALAELIARMMAKDPRARPASAVVVKAELAAIAGAPRPLVRVSRFFWAKLALGAVVLGLLSSAAVQVLKRREQPVAIVIPMPAPAPSREEPSREEPEPAVVVELPEGDAPEDLPSKKSKRPRRTKVAPAAPAPRGQVKVEVWTTAGRILPAEVIVDGARAASAELELVEGAHVIEVRPVGYPAQKKTVEVRASQAATVRFVAD